MYFNKNEKAPIIYIYIYAHSTFLTVFSIPYILTQCLTRLDRHRKSTQNTEIHLVWLQRRICRGRGLRPLMRKITCSAFWFHFAHRYTRMVSYSVLTLVTEWRLCNQFSLSDKLMFLGLHIETTNFIASVFWILSVLFFVTIIDCKNVDNPTF